MAVDYLTTDTELTSVANAIRTKGGTSASLVYPTGFVSAIEAISTGGVVVSDTTDSHGGTIRTITTTQTPVTLQAKTGITPGASAVTVTPDTGYNGMSSVQVNGDANLVAGNIKNGTTIFGVTGTYSGGGGGGSIKRISGSGNTTVYPTGWSSADFGSGSVPGESDVINANDPKFLVAHVTIGGVIRSFVASRMEANYIRFSGSYSTSDYSNPLNVSITSTSGYVNSIQFPATVSNKAIGSWEIISNLPVRSEPQSGTFYIDHNGEQVECNFDGDTPTWVEWLQSEYNIEIGLSDDGEYVTFDGGFFLYYDEYPETPVEVNDAITANATYYLI